MTILMLLLSLCYMLTLSIIYFKQKHIDSKEIKVFTRLIFLNIIGLLTEIIVKVCCWTITNENIITIVLTKFYFVYIISFSLTMAYYVYLLSTNSETKETKNQIIVKRICYIIAILISIGAIILPFDVVSPTSDYCTGLAVNLVYGSCSILIGACLLLMFKNVKTIKMKKSFPLAIYFAGMFLGAFIQRINPNITITTVVESFVLFIMYFTIENPDLKMLNQMELAKTQAERSNRAKSDFLSSMSHEIRTPLNAIVGLSEDIATYENEVPKEVVEDTEDIRNASQTLLEIVGNILDINKIESEKMEIVENPYNFREEITNMCKVIATRIGDKNIDFKLNIADDLPYELIGDKVHIKEIVNNLLTNSIKYTEQGQINLNVRCVNDFNNMKSNIMISCQDTGRGIKQEYINKLFTKFERLDIEKNTTTEGTGLGLAITKALVEMMDGKINVQSQFGRGSIFMVQIPNKISKIDKPMSEKELLDTAKRVYDNQSSNLESIEITTLQQNNNEIKNYGRKKILIVDDNALNIKVATRALKDFNFIIEEANDGQICLDKVDSSNDYDLILMDIMMPNMSGENALKKLKEKSDFKTPVIALTADAVAGAKEKYISEGFVDYIAKPFSKDQIKEKLDIVFSNSNPEQVNANNSVPKYDENIDRWKDVPAYVYGNDDSDSSRPDDIL